MLPTTTYVAEPPQTTESVVIDCLELDDLWAADDDSTAALTSDATALIAARLDVWRRQIDRAVASRPDAVE